MSANMVAVLYLISALMFIFALRGLSHPESSRLGNIFGIVGMIIALIIPAVKELYYDKYLGKGNCEWADYFYSIAPTIMFAIMRY